MDDGTTAGGTPGTSSGQASLPSDPAAIEALIARRRADLASTIDELVVRARPKEIARRSAAVARVRARDFAFSPDGQPRVERLVAVGTAVIALLGLAVLQRRRGRRAR